MPTGILRSADGREATVTFDQAPSQEDIDEATAQVFGAPEPEAETGPGFLRQAAATTVEVGAPIVGGIGGTMLAGPAGGVAGGAAGGVAGRYLAEKIRGEEATGRELVASGIVGGIPGGAAAKFLKGGAGLAKRTVVHALEGATLGAGSTVVQRGIEAGELPSGQEVLQAGAVGAMTGGALGAALGARPKVAATEVTTETAQKAAAINAADTAAPVAVTPPPGQRRIVLPGESIPPHPDEPTTLFGPDGKVISEAAPVLERRMSVPMADTLRDDVFKQADVVSEALATLSPDVKKQRFFRQLNTAIKDGLFNPEETTALLHRNGWTMRQFFEEEVVGGLSKFEGDVSSAAKLINRVGQEKKRVMAVLASDPETRKIVDDLAVAGGQDNPFSRLWREVIDLDDASRAMVISQIATAHRNTVTQSARLLLEVPTDAVKGALERVGMKAQSPAGNPLATLWGVGAAVKPGDTGRVLSMLEKLGPEGEIIARRLFGTSTAEGPFVSGVQTGRPIRGLPATMKRTAKEGFRERRIIKTILGPVADASTAYNQLHENFYRRAAFQGRLMKHAEKQGEAWSDVQQNPGLLSTEAYDDALQHSLNVTYAAEPESKLGKELLRAARMTQPLSTLFVTFPRYIANFGKFFLDFSPAGALRLFSPAIREEKGADVLARSVVGTALLGAGVGMRMSDKAGERWYEMKSGPEDQERTNIVGLAGPFLPYAFLGELVAQQLRDEPVPREMDGEDFVQGLVGLRISPGTKAIFDAIAEKKPAAEAVRGILDKTVAEFLGRFSVGLRTIKDFAAEYGNDAERLYLDPKEILELGDVRTRVLNPTIQNVPGLGEALDRPAAVSAITGKERIAEKTGLRQLTGATVRTPTPLGIELDRLGMAEYDLAPKTGIPKVDRELSRRTGAVAQLVAPKILEGEKYQALSPGQQKLLWTRLYKGFRKAALDNLKQTNPELAEARRVKEKYTTLEKEAAKEAGLDVDEIIYQIVKGAPGQ